MSFPEHRFNGAPKLFKMQSILCVSCVCSLMYTSSTCVQIFSAFERAVMFLAENHNIQNGRHFMDENVKTFILVFFFILFQTDLNKYTMKLIVLKIK